MAKSYKITLLKKIESEKFGTSPSYLGEEQQHFEEIERPASTTIQLSGDRVSIEDFVKYNIEHESGIFQRV